jgi:flagellin
MSSVSVHTNNSAMIALQNLNKTQGELGEVQQRINTGLKVNGAKDNASVWAIAQGQRADIGALSAVKMSLDRATSISDVALAAGESISDLLNQVKEKVVSSMDPSLDTNSRTLLNADYQALLRQISQVSGAAEFDGANILDGSLATDIQFLANADSTSYITLSVKDLTLGGGIIGIAATSSIGTVTAATGVLATLDASISQLNQSMGDLGAQAKQIAAHTTFIGKLNDVLTSILENGSRSQQRRGDRTGTGTLRCLRPPDALRSLRRASRC